MEQQQITTQLSPRDELARSIFGEQSVKITHDLNTEIAQNLPESTTYFGQESLIQMVVAMTLMLYVVWIVKLIAHRKRGIYTGGRWIYGDKEVRGQDTIAIAMSDVVLSLCLMLGLVTMLLSVAVEWAEIYSAESSSWLAGVAENFSSVMTRVSLEQTVIGISAYLILSTLLFASIFCLFTLGSNPKQWIREIARLKARMIYPMMLYFMPFVALLALDSEIEVLRYIVMCEAVALTIYYIIRSFLLFVAQKISILQWFLYLCTVEILPITLAWVYFVRSVR